MRQGTLLILPCITSLNLYEIQCLYPNRVDCNLISDTNHPNLVSDLTNEGLRSSRDCPHFRCQPGAPKPPSLLTMWLQIQGFLGPSEV